MAVDPCSVTCSTFVIAAGVGCNIKDFSSACRVKKEILSAATPKNFYHQDINITILCNLHTFTTVKGTAVSS
jgi:hypothetical protein